MRFVAAIPTQRCAAAIEHWSVDNIVGILAVVEVWLVPFVTTLIAESLLVGPCEIPVPREEVSLTKPSLKSLMPGC